MKQQKDISGSRFGMLVAVRESHRRGNQIYWMCRCDCGNCKPISKGELTRSSGAAKSCGCLKKKNGVIHGQRSSPAYRKWRQMRARVRNPDLRKNSCYRGVSICRRWDSFANFLEDMGEPPPGYTLDRIDNRRGYAPENCRWATWKQQGNNHSGVRLMEFRGKRQSMKAWAEEIGVKYSTLANRLNVLGWTVEKALTAPSQPIRSSPGYVRWHFPAKQRRPSQR